MPHVKYLWDEIEDNVIAEYDDNGNTVAVYTTEPTLYGAVLTQDRGAEVRHYHHDGLGNTTELTNESSIVTDIIRYNAYGDTVLRTGSSALAFGYVGQAGYHGDAVVEMIYVRRRWLATNGRWLAADPAFDGVSYDYCNNRPLLLSDPSGLRPDPESPPLFKRWQNEMEIWRRQVLQYSGKVCWSIGFRATDFELVKLRKTGYCPQGPFAPDLGKSLADLLADVMVEYDRCPKHCPCLKAVLFQHIFEITGENQKMEIWWKEIVDNGQAAGYEFRFVQTPGFAGVCRVEFDYTASGVFEVEAGECVGADPPRRP